VIASPDNAPHHRAAAKRPELKERRGRRLRVHVIVMPHKLQPLMLDLQTIRKLAYKSKAIAAGMLGSSAQQELMMIERTADVLVARVLDEMGASCDRTKFGGNNEVSQSYSAPETDKPLLPPWESV